MHTLHTTEAYILSSTPHGESSRVYALFTKKFGYLYAHGQGVRDIRNRNRFALALGKKCRVTLVRGRETWRITGAQSLEGAELYAGGEQKLRSAYIRKLFSLLASLAPRETPHTDVFSLLESTRSAVVACNSAQVRDVEAVSALRLLHILGYVGEASKEWPNDVLAQHPLSPLVLGWARENRRQLLHAINRGIRSATA